MTRSSTPSIYPGFCLSSGTKARGVNLRLRPLASGEMVPVPPGMSDDIEEQWLKGNWVLEYVKASDVEESLVVRQTWLLEKPREGETSWDGLFRVEHLLVSCKSPDPTDASIDKRPARRTPTTAACLSLTRRTLCTLHQMRVGLNNAGQWLSLDRRLSWWEEWDCQEALPDLKRYWR